jgi:lipoprotein-anchoring transpeptidase ErfK/SrfK
VRRLGTPASHGCIRLHTANAAALYSLIKRYGRGSTRIRVVN